MKKNGIVYKVARFDTDLYCYQSLCGGRYSITYKLGKKYFPTIGDGLFAFSNKKDAINFMIYCRWLGVIYKGMATNIRSVKFMASVDYNCHSIDDYWKRKRSHKRYDATRIADVPQGTVLVSSFSCDKTVYSRTMDRPGHIIDQNWE